LIEIENSLPILIVAVCFAGNFAKSHTFGIGRWNGVEAITVGTGSRGGRPKIASRIGWCRCGCRSHGGCSRLFFHPPGWRYLNHSRIAAVYGLIELCQHGAVPLVAVMLFGNGRIRFTIFDVVQIDIEIGFRFCQCSVRLDALTESVKPVRQK
jgi:hypothetical protein